MLRWPSVPSGLKIQRIGKGRGQGLCFDSRGVQKSRRPNGATGPGSGTSGALSADVVDSEKGQNSSRSEDRQEGWGGLEQPVAEGSPRSI